jgi:F-type H+-transporting ATPase subunit gamma
MATILSLKRRMQSAQNVCKATKAMQMIAASKLKRAQEAAISTRPYVNALDSITKKVVSTLDKGSINNNPYLRTNTKSGKTLLIIVSPDKGLCGGLISNLIHKYNQHKKTNEKDIYTLVIGRKVEGSIARVSKEKMIASFNFGTTTPAIDAIQPIMKVINEYYLSGKVDKVEVLYAHFKGFFSQIPTITPLLPISLPIEDMKKNPSSSPYLFEPGAEEILLDLILHHIEMSLYHFFLESFVSEQASRMIAMQNATNNAKEVTEDLRLEYNKTRQAKVTSEILDITGARMAVA